MRTVAIISSALALVATFVIWPELKSGVLIDRQVREIDRPYGPPVSTFGYFPPLGSHTPFFRPRSSRREKWLSSNLPIQQGELPPTSRMRAVFPIALVRLIATSIEPPIYFNPSAR